jgi:hypothetical protein
LTMIKLPRDEFVAIELVHEPGVCHRSAAIASATSSYRCNPWASRCPNSLPVASTPRLRSVRSVE